MLLESPWLDNNCKLILEGMLRSRLQKLRSGQLERPLKIHKIHVFSFNNLKMKLYKDNVCVITWVLLLMCSQMTIMILVQRNYKCNSPYIARGQM